MKQLLTAIALLAIASHANANLHLEFKEGAPKDRFVLSNVGECMLTDMQVTIDLKNSAGKLIFDVTGNGAGVEVFQPFEIESGSKFIAASPVVVDGQTEVSLDMIAFAAGNKLVVSTDLDDTINSREITVNATEFSGTVVNVTINGKTSSATVGDSPQATVQLQGC